MNEKVKYDIASLVDQAKIAFVSSVDEEGFPNCKAMLSLRHDNLITHYFSTMLSSKRTQQFLNNSKACVYFCNENKFLGLMLVGEMQVLTDRDHKVMLWRDGFEIYYPQGVDTQDYCVFKFTAHKANYYNSLDDMNFEIKEYENA